MDKEKIINLYSPIEHIRSRLAAAKALPTLCLLGVLCGLVVGLVMVLFRIYMETVQLALLPGDSAENYEGLKPIQRFLLTVSGGCLLAIVYCFLGKGKLRVGIIHVLERLAYHEGHLPMKNMVLQFFAGSIAIISGQSVGREGPIVHLGSATSSLLGQYLHLPNNSIRVLVACGAAGSIAASFNTPLAGVIFAMEVIMMEYTINSFMPVILAAVSATMISRLAFDSQTIFQVPPIALLSYWDLIPLIIMGIFIGLNAGFFIKFLQAVTLYSKSVVLPLRLLIASVSVGLIAMWVPEVMSIGYDTVNQALVGELTLSVLILIIIAKLVATCISIGMGFPAGLIGPSLFMGAICGGIVGLLAEMVFELSSAPSLYAMLGMGAMMGATLNAPLAALAALLELTGNPNSIFPGMLAIVCSNLTARQLFTQGSVYQVQMKELGIDYNHDPMSQSLRRVGVSSIMNQSYAIVEHEITVQSAQKVILEKPAWLVIRRQQGHLLMPTADLVRYIAEQRGTPSGAQQAAVDLLEIPSRRLQLAPVYQQSTLQQALTILESGESEALYVIRRMSASADRIYGIITRQDIDKGYRLHKTDY